MSAVLWVGLGGFLGAVSRWGLLEWSRTAFAHPFPVGTLFINALGSLLVGFLFEAIRPGPSMSAIHLFLGVGILGGFTTFSTFSLDTLKLVQTGRMGTAFVYAMGSLILSLLAVFAGAWAGRLAQS